MRIRFLTGGMEGTRQLSILGAQQGMEMRSATEADSASVVVVCGGLSSKKAGQNDLPFLLAKPPSPVKWCLGRESNPHEHKAQGPRDFKSLFM